MKVKKHYNIGDIVWIYGINSLSNKATQGKVVHSFQMTGYDGVFYIVAVPTEIEDLLEVRTWHNISQDQRGPVGSFREAVQDPVTAKKFLSRVGIVMEDGALHDPDDKYTGDGHEDMGSTLDDFYNDEPTPDEIHAAMERAKQSSTMQPLNLKDHPPKRRYFKKKPKA